MNQPTKPHGDEHGAGGGHMLDEADIGSGERSPGQRETDEAIKSIPPLPDDGEQGKPKQAPRP
ncbi:hypothetical protein SAMN05428959_104163 [Duganella sp. CF517]|uniref:hypothetical protein n=1 Tax=Duganella sp. CF517 TaxID=1881038 RepID=UPI0008AE8357|nr:hypothetical protein [Duganella sp. CF517]SEO00979.1 hypothetical protein SAMN05428959_104163 [Duganella sp. CF517]